MPRGTLAFTGPTSLAVSTALRPHFCALTQPTPPSPDDSISSHFALLALAFNLHPDDIELVDPTTGHALKAIHPDTSREDRLRHLQNPVIVRCLRRPENRWPLPSYGQRTPS